MREGAYNSKLNSQTHREEGRRGETTVVFLMSGRRKSEETVVMFFFFFSPKEARGNAFRRNDI